MSTLHAEFANYLPLFRAHARYVFRFLRAEERNEKVQEAVASAWQSFVRLKQRGKCVAEFSSALARFAAKAVRNGRRVGGPQSSTDVLSPLCQAKRGFIVKSLDDRSGLKSEIIREALVDNGRAEIADHVAFRLDFPDWVARLSDRSARIAIELAEEKNTAEVARKHGLTAGRISQMRRELATSWQCFQRGAA